MPRGPSKRPREVRRVEGKICGLRTIATVWGPIERRRDSEFFTRHRVATSLLSRGTFLHPLEAAVKKGDIVVERALVIVQNVDRKTIAMVEGVKEIP